MARRRGRPQHRHADRRRHRGRHRPRAARYGDTELHLRFGEGRITAARDLDLTPTSLDGLVGLTQQVLGQVLHQVAAPGQVSLPGILDGGELQPEDVDVSVDLLRLLRVALRAVR